MRRLLLKQKVALSLALVSFISLLVVGSLVFLYVHSILIENKKTDILSSSEEQVHESILTFKNNELFARMLSNQTQAKDFLSDRTEIKKTELLDIFQKYSDKEKKYLAIYLLNKTGIALVSTDLSLLGRDFSFHDYFKKAIKGESNISEDIDVTKDQPGYYFTSPVLGDKNEIIGVIVAKIDPSDIDDPILSSEVSKENYLMLVNESGIILVSTEAGRKFKSLSVLSDQERIKFQENEKFMAQEIIPLSYDLVRQGIRDYKKPVILNFYDKEDQDNEMIVLSRLDGFPYYLITEIRLDSLNNQVVETVSVVVVIILFILVVLSFVIYFILTLFIRPIDKFKSYFTNISKGNFSPKLEVKTGDEFDDMASSVNKMSEDLSGLYKNLDEKVKEQTSKLEREKTNAEKLASDLEKFKLAVDNAFDQITITDAEGTVIYVNKAIERITGFKAEEAVGKKVGVLWKSPMSTEYYDKLWDVIKNQKKTFLGEIQNKRKNGEPYTAMMSISSVLNKEGDIIYFVAIQRDITKEKQVDRAKTEFVSLASHQLRAPLSAINWYTEMLLDKDTGPLNDEQKDFLNEIAIGNKRMVDLVDNFLNVSRLDMGTFRIDTKPIDVLKLVKNVLDESQSQILEKKLKIKESYSEVIPKFWADEKLLRVVFQNLLSNAIKYTLPAKEIKIYVSKLNKGEIFGEKILDQESLVFSVSDSGIGIPVYQKDFVFSKLFRADNAKEFETEGTGLGLYVVKSIVDQSGGSVWFSSEENKGSTFYVAFPLSGMVMK